MSIGTSGRVVIEIDPDIKRHLYSALARDGLTLKDWFLREAQTYVAEAHQHQRILSSNHLDEHLNPTSQYDDERKRTVANHKLSESMHHRGRID